MIACTSPQHGRRERINYLLSTFGTSSHLLQTWLPGSGDLESWLAPDNTMRVPVVTAIKVMRSAFVLVVICCAGEWFVGFAQGL